MSLSAERSVWWRTEPSSNGYGRISVAAPAVAGAAAAAATTEPAVAAKYEAAVAAPSSC